jgi:hypothetical protein
MDNYGKILDRLETKLDDQNEHLSSIDVTLGVQSVQLRQHIQRTNELQKIVVQVQKHVLMVNGALKLLGIIATIVGITLAIHEILK